MQSDKGVESNAEWSSVSAAISDGFALSSGEGAGVMGSGTVANIA